MEREQDINVYKHLELAGCVQLSACIVDLLVRTKTMRVTIERHCLISLVSRLGLSGSVVARRTSMLRRLRESQVRTAS